MASPAQSAFRNPALFMPGSGPSLAPGSSYSALDPLLLAIDSRFDAVGGARIFPRHLAEGGAGGFFFLKRRQRLAEPQQRVRRLGRFVVFAGHRQKGFGGLAVLLALEQTLAEPVLRVRNQRIVRIFLH